MTRTITNIVVDLKDGQRISIKADSGMLDFCAQFATIEEVCKRYSGHPKYQVAAVAIIQAAGHIGKHGNLEDYMMPTFSVCVEQLHDHLSESYEDDYSGGIYVSEADDDEIQVNDFYFIALNGQLEPREHGNLCITATVRSPSDEPIH